MSARAPRPIAILPLVAVAPMGFFAFEAVRVAMTLGSRSTVVVAATATAGLVAAAITLPLVDRSSRGVIIALLVVAGAARLAMQLLEPAPTLVGKAIPAGVIIGVFGSLIAAVAVVHGGRVAGIGMMLASAIDVAVGGLLSTLGLVWRSSSLSMIVVVALVAMALAAAWFEHQVTMPVRTSARVPAAALLAVGPWMALHLAVFANLGRLSLRIGVDPWVAALVAALAATAPLVWETPGRRASQPAVAAIIPVAAAALLPSADGAWAGVLVVVLAAGAGVALTGAMERDSSAAPERVEWAAGTVGVLAVLPVVAIELEGDRLIEPDQVVLITTLLLLAASVLCLRHNPAESAPAPMAIIIALVAGVAAVVPWFVAQPSPAEPFVEPELLAATFNTNRGFSFDDRFDPLATLDAAESLAADVVALQDVTRGRLRDGSIDFLALVDRRLGGVSGWDGSEDGLGVSAVSRFETAEVESVGVGGVADAIRLTYGLDERIFTVVAVDATRSVVSPADQARFLTELWGGGPQTIVTGTLGARPDEDPVFTLVSMGLFDVMQVLPDVNPLTFPADLPVAQLDYILITSDLRPAGARVDETLVSTHRPVAALLSVPLEDG